MRTTPSRRRWPTVAAGVTASLVLGTGYGTGQTIGHQTTLTGTVPANTLIVTVTEGPGEPRSIGSYALRVYDPLHPDFPYDHFIAGTVQKRDGAVEELLFRDLDDDGIEEALVVVTVRRFRRIPVRRRLPGYEERRDGRRDSRRPGTEHRSGPAAPENNQPHHGTVNEVPKGPRNSWAFIRRARAATNRWPASGPRALHR